MAQKPQVQAIQGEDSSTAVLLPWPTARATHGAPSGGGGVAPPADTPGAVQGRRQFLTLAAAATAIFAGAAASDAMVMDAEAAEELAVELAALPDIPDPVPGQPEDPIVRMMRDVRRALAKPLEERRWVMVIDERKCTGCQGCTIACIQENKLPPGVVYRPVIEEVSGTYPAVSKRIIPRPCMQCDDPPCVPVCPVSATWLRADGIVEIDYEACIGCRYCLTACPYNARTSDFGSYYGDEEGSGGPLQFENVSSFEYGKAWNREGDESPIGNARKCHFCLHRITDGLLPACVVSCMGRATYFGDSNDPESLVSELISQPNVSRLKEEAGTNPKVYYLS